MKTVRTLSMIGLGALLMYFFDPRLGQRRRSTMKDQMNSRFRRSVDTASKFSRDLRHRIKGASHRFGNKIPSQDLTVSDSLLEARVRSKIGRYLNHHPHTFNVNVKDGEVTISGEMSQAVYQRIYPVISKMSGVQSVHFQAPQKKSA